MNLIQFDSISQFQLNFIIQNVIFYLFQTKSMAILSLWMFKSTIAV